MSQGGSSLNFISGDDASASGATKDLFTLIRSGASFSGRERNCAFLNTGGGRFANISAVSGIDYPDDGRALAQTDWDQDGDLDVWLVNRSGPQVRFLRNDTPTTNRWIALRLQGKTCNRDAIGARVEITPTNPESGIRNLKLIKTLRAGDAFLSQSSKWLTFGLGPADIVEEMIVRWPDGSAQRFTGLETNHRYRIVQGNGGLEEMPLRPGSMSLQAFSGPVPPRPSLRRQLLSTPVLFPQLDYLDFEGGSARREPGDGLLLINLWASWCGPCRTELGEWVAREKALRKVGLEILPLSVDGLAMSRQSAPADANRFLESISFPFESGVATVELLDKIEVLQRFLFDLHIPFAVPTSFLLDADGNLVAIYRGSVDVETLSRDGASFAGVREEHFQRSVPFPGRWAAMTTFQWRSLAEPFRKQFPDEELRYLRFAIEKQASELNLKRSRGVNTRRDTSELVGTYGRLAELLLRSGNLKEASALYADAHTLRPNDPRLPVLALDLSIARTRKRLDANVDHVNNHMKLADLYFRKRDHLNSIRHYEQALELDSGIVRARANLAQLLRISGNPGDAIKHYQKVLESEPDQVRCLDGLAILLASDPDAAVRNGEEAVKIALRACGLTGHADPARLDTLAAAYAEAGKFDKAVETVESAISLASDPQKIMDMKSRLSLYRSERPFRSHSDSPH